MDEILPEEASYLNFKSEFNFGKPGEDGDNCCQCEWRVQRYKLGQQLLKDENEKLKQALSSTKTLMNMVIHDLRSPCSQIKFAMMLALQKLEQIEKACNKAKAMQKDLLSSAKQIEDLVQNSDQSDLRQPRLLQHIREENHSTDDLNDELIAIEEAIAIV